MSGGIRTLRAFVAIAVVLGALSMIAIVGQYAGAGVGPAATFALLAAALVAADVVPLPVPRGEQLEDVEVEEPFLVAMLVLLPPVGILAAAVTATLIGNVRRRRAPLKSMFNLGNTATAVGLAVLTRHLALAGIGVELGDSAGADVAAAAAAVVVFVGYEMASVYTAISIADRRPFLAVAGESFGISSLITVSGISIGLAVGLAGRVAWWAPLTLLAPGVVVLLLLRSHLHALRDRRRLDGLLHAATDAHASIDVRQVTDSVRQSTKLLLRAGDVQIRDQGPTGDELGARVSDGTADRWLVVSERHHLDPFERGEQQLLEGLATIGSAALSNAQLVDRVAHQVVHDPVTDLPNRLLLEDRVSQAVARALRFGERFAVLALDIDRFKRVNESLGHAIGDQLLREASARLLGVVRRTDTVARTGGNEFTVLLANIHDGEEPVTLLESILDRLREPFHIEGRQLFVTASAGLAIYPDHGRTHKSLLDNADAALHRAKDRGRDTYEIYADQVSLPRTRLLLESDLHHALARGEIWVAYQPLIDLRLGVATGAEALVRWSHPRLGELSPDDFLPVAEESGLVAHLDTFVLLTACRQAMRWNAGRARTERMHVAVNFSARQLHSPRILDIVTDSLAATGLAPSLLEIEVTERLAGRDSPQVPAVLTRLRELGVRVAMDDFGTGYSSLSRLDVFPLDNVKIDKSFVRRIVSAGDDAPIVSASIAMAHGLGLRVTAEGVESPEQLAFLERHGCDVVQGYLLGRPLRGDGSRPARLDVTVSEAAERTL